MSKTTTFNDTTYMTLSLWSEAINWSNGVPADGDNVTLVDSSSFDDVTSVTTLASLYLDAPYNSYFVIAQLEILVPSLYITTVTAAYPDSLGADASYAGAPVTVTVGTIADASGSYGAQGTGGVFLDQSAVDQGEDYVVVQGGFTELWATPASTSFFFYNEDGDVQGTFLDESAGTFALKNPAASNAAQIKDLGNGDALELPGTLVKAVSFGAGSFTVTTDAGSYAFTNVIYAPETVDGYTATVNGYNASVDPSTGLIDITFTTGPAITGAVAGQPVEEGSNIAPFAGVAITDAYPDQTETVTVSLSDPANGTLYDLGAGTYDAATGVYSVTGTTLGVTAAIEALRFASTAHQAAPSKSVTTDFTISVTDTVGATETNTITSVVASYPAVPAPYTAGDSDGYVNLLPINGNNVVTTDQNFVTVAGSTDAQAGATIVTELVSYTDSNGTPVAGNNAVAQSAPAAIIDAGYKDANGNEVSSFASSLPTAGLPPGLYVAESFIELNGQTTPLYAGGGPDGQQIISVDPTNQQNTILQIAGTNATLTADGRYLIYTAINEYNEPEITGDIYARDLLTGAEQNLTEEGLTNLPYADAVNHNPTTVTGNGAPRIDYPTFTSANGAYTYRAINNFDLDLANNNYDPEPVVIDNSTGDETVIGGIGTQKYFVGAPVAASDDGDVVLSEGQFPTTYQAAGSAYIENPDPEIYITYIGPAPSLTINPVNADNHVASNSTAVTISGTSDANGQTVTVETGGVQIGQAVVTNGTWSFVYDPGSLPATSLALQASVTGADGTPAESFDTATIVPGPTITGFTASASSFGTVLGPDQTLTITLDSSIAVDVTGTPALLLSNGTQAHYLSGSGTGQLEFAYIPQITDSGATDLSVTGISLATGSAIEDPRGDTLTGSAVGPLGFSLQTAPVIYDLSPSSQESDFLTNTFTPQVEVGAERGETISLYDNNILVGTGVTPDYGYAGITYVEITISATAPLPEGNSELTAIATDTTGTSAPSSVAINVDTIPPPETISGLTINTGDFVSLADQQNLSAVITGTLSGAIEAGDSIVLDLPGGNSELVTPAAGTTSFSFTVPAFQAEFFGASGSVSAYIEDEAGNIGSTISQSYTAAAICTITLLSADPAAPLQAAGSAPAISANGSTVAFYGSAAQYGGTSVSQGVYVQDLATGAVTLAAAGGADPTLSDAGTMLAYDRQGQVYAKNLTTGKVTTVSVDDVNPANAAAFGSSGPSISADGNKIAFVSNATDLVQGVTASGGQVYVATLSSSGAVSGVSVASVAQSGGSGASAPDGAYTDAAAISGDGSEVVFASSATNLLAPNDPAAANLNGQNQQIYVKALTNNAVTGLQAGRVELVSGLSDGTAGDGYSDSDGVSANGRYVVFTSTSDNLNPINLAPGTVLPAGVKQVYVKDLVTGNISLVSLNASGVPGDGSVTYASISADGGTIVFSDNADNLFHTPLNPSFDQPDGQLFAATMVAGQVERLTLLSEAGAVPGNDPSMEAVVSDDGGMVAFSSNSENLAANSPGGYVNQVYVTPGPQFAVQTLVVTTLLDSGAGSLRAVAAEAQAGDIVNFAANIDGGTIQLATPVDLAGGVTINGAGNGITVAGNNFTPALTVQTPGGLPATIIGLTIENGKHIGGVDVAAGTVALSNDAFTGDTAADGGLNIGFGANSHGLASVHTGTLSLTGALTVGDAGAGSFAVTGTGTVTAATLTVGTGAANAGALTISGTAATLAIANGFTIGLQGGAGAPSVTIADGATVTSDTAASSDYDYFPNGTLTLETGAHLTENEMDMHDAATLLVTSGAVLTETGAVTGGGSIPAGLEVNGMVTLLGGTLASPDAATFIGAYTKSGGSGIGAVTAEAAAVATNLATFLGVYQGPSDNGALTLTGSGTTWTDSSSDAVDNNDGGLDVGYSGNGTLLVAGGAVVSNPLTYIKIGQFGAATGTATVTGAGSALNAGGLLRVGDSGQGTLTVENAATATIGDVQVGDYSGATGTLNITSGATVTTTLSTVDTGAQRGATVTAGEFDIGVQTGSNGLVAVDGGTLNVAGTLLVSDRGAGVLKVGNGLVTAAEMDVGAAGIVDVLAGGVVDAGLVHIATGGAINLQGGTVDPPSPITIDAGGAVTGFGTLSGDLQNNGILQATLGAVAILGTVSGTGTIAVQSGGKLLLDGVVEAGQTVNFAGTGATLAFGPNAVLDAPISGFGAGDVLELPGSVAPGVTFGTDSLTIATSNGPLVFTDVNVSGLTATYDPAMGLESISFATGISLSGTSTESTILAGQTETGGTFGIGNTSSSAGGWTLVVNGTVNGGTAGIANAGSLGARWSITGNGAVLGGTDGVRNTGNLGGWDVQKNIDLSGTTGSGISNAGTVTNGWDVVSNHSVEGGTDGVTNTGTTDGWDVKSNDGLAGTTGSGVNNAGTVTNGWDVKSNKSVDGGTDGATNSGVVGIWDVESNDSLAGTTGSGVNNAGTVTSGWDLKSNNADGGTDGATNTGVVDTWDVKTNGSLTGISGSGASNTGTVTDGWDLETNQNFSGGTAGISNARIVPKADVILNRRVLNRRVMVSDSTHGNVGDVAGGWTIAENGTISGGADGISNDGSVIGGWTIADNGTISGSTGDGITNTGTVAGGWTIAGNTLTSGGTDGISNDGTVTGGWTVAQNGTISGGTAGFSNTGMVAGGWTLAQNGALSGGTDGVFDSDGGGSVTNQGSITGQAGAGIRLTNGGAVNNLVGARILGDTDGVFIGNGGTVTNAGTIGATNGLAVDFTGTGLNRLVVDPGAKFLGNVAAGPASESVLELASASAAGTLSGLGASFAGFGTITLDAGADWTLAGASTLGAGQSLADYGSLTAAGLFTNDGLIITDPSVMVFDSAVTGTGTIEIGADSDVVFFGSVASSETIVFLGSTGTLTINDPAEFKAAIIGTGHEDIACFCAGTRILTAQGALLRVEELQEGDEVETFAGEAARIVWIGRRTIAPRLHPRPDTVQPILITAGALGNGLPWRDLVVSPDHALYLEGHLIPAKALTNGFTIRQLNRETVTYYHIELPEHAVLFAEGAGAESYLETGNRAAFENGGTTLTLHPDFAQKIREQRGCAPFADSGKAVEAVRQRILDRAGIETASAPDLQICYENGTAIIASRSTIPGEIFADPRDRRRLGVKIASLRADGHGIPLDHPALTVGWHDPEPDGRWTDGRAEIPMGLLGGSKNLQVSLAAALRYPLRRMQAARPKCRADRAV
jgi:T5SS/PEP-CTERM-associated repeat protein